MMKTQTTSIWHQVFPSENWGNFKPSSTELINFIRDGIPGASLGYTAEVLDITKNEMCKLLHISPRTARRKVLSRLNIGKSDHLVQIAKVFQRCIDVFGNREKALRWVKSPNYPLGNQIPLDMMDTNEGIDFVQDALTRLESGV